MKAHAALVFGAMLCAQHALSADAALPSEQSQGRALFNESCVMCHGERGHATALLARRVGTENAVLERRGNLAPEFIKHVVRNGLNSMPWYRRAELSDRELDLLIAYLTRPQPQ